ncbi:excinuclease ABC subunit UvrB [Spiroplasma taiwanense]|uniref:UvrABC system protein B n=1 Tax=Spiroplasma taiwanense CT-1 TaxID=1276220 RepID=S5LSW4_9MOLU|nr:excinuclease ABC subunit UvrB [Spiroplasma taiwanense]AGR40759.1 excinuclease ABC subunit B [Spiroplasma taiwanense CT-1]
MKKEFKKFNLVTEFTPGGDQPKAIKDLIEGIKANKKHQVLMGATGTGKTFTMANIIKDLNKPTLVLAHNKTLAMQLYIELKELFPNNRVEYFVSNFDFYQPEAYIPSRDLYIDKDAKRNNDLEMMRLSAMNALMIRQDTIVVASVAAIYATQDPKEYGNVFFELNVGQILSKKQLLTFLIQTGYTRNETNLDMGCFSAKGDVIKIAPSWTDKFNLRISMFGDEIESLDLIDVLNNTVEERLHMFTIFPAAAYVTNFDKMKLVVENIEKELILRVKELEKEGKLIEADRLTKRTKYDMETLTEFGICSGIENYSAHLDFRPKGVPPFSLIDYFGDDFLTIIDESHMMIPQIRGMFNTDRSRKETLVAHGFRLPSALDNRPLNFEEFAGKLKNVIYTSATPGDYELNLVENKVVEQIIRPTGLIDPIIEIRGTMNQMNEIVQNVNQIVEKKQKVFITTLTIRASEDITTYLQSRSIKVAYLHSELKTLERNQILIDLRKGVYDVIVGVNLLREGLDIPEVSLVCILDADKQGFLRNTRSLIQTVGRAARNAEGRVIFYADSVSPAMKEAIEETDRRRNIQIEYNLKNNIIPKTITKKISDFGMDINIRNKIDELSKLNKKDKIKNKEKLIEDLRKQMLFAAKEQNYEKAAELRDLILEIQSEE